MSRRNQNRAGSGRPPFDAAQLQALAISYVGRYATTRSRLAQYLTRKIAERGWAGEGAPPVDAIVARCVALGYVDDAAFAAARGAALARRGFGARRIGQALYAAGIDAQDAEPVCATARESALESALLFARRKRIGPYAVAPLDEDRRRRALAAMLRAGHAFEVARRVVNSAIGVIPTEE